MPTGVYGLWPFISRVLADSTVRPHTALVVLSHRSRWCTTWTFTVWSTRDHYGYGAVTRRSNRNQRTWCFAESGGLAPPPGRTALCCLHQLPYRSSRLLRPALQTRSGALPGDRSALLAWHCEVSGGRTRARSLENCCAAVTLPPLGPDAGACTSRDSVGALSHQRSSAVAPWTRTPWAGEPLTSGVVLAIQQCRPKRPAQPFRSGTGI